jgi:hypothetical protein
MVAMMIMMLERECAWCTSVKDKFILHEYSSAKVKVSIPSTSLAISYSKQVKGARFYKNVSFRNREI